MSECVLAQVRRALRGTALEGGFLRRSEERDWLLASDLPKRAPPDNAEAFLTREGFSWALTNGLLFIGLSYAQLDALLSERGGEPPPFPKDTALLPAYGLLRLLCAHPGGGGQPKLMIYDYLKAEERGRSAVLALAPKLTEDCAARLRLGQPLPTALIGCLKQFLSEGSDTV